MADDGWQKRGDWRYTPRSAPRLARSESHGKPRRWVLYATSQDRALGAFGKTVSSAGRAWKPVAVEPYRLDEAVKAIQPEAVIVGTQDQRDERLLRRALALYGQHRIVVDDRDFGALAKLLRLGC